MLLTKLEIAKKLKVAYTEYLYEFSRLYKQHSGDELLELTYKYLENNNLNEGMCKWLHHNIYLTNQYNYTNLLEELVDEIFEGEYDGLPKKTGYYFYIGAPIYLKQLKKNSKDLMNLINKSLQTRLLYIQQYIENNSGNE